MNKSEIEINKGALGTVYKVTKGSKTYALKKNKISEEVALELKLKFKNEILLEDTNNQYTKEIYFNKFINKKSKQHFAVLYKYKIEECDFNHQLDETYKKIITGVDKWHLDLQSSKYCLTKLYDLKDGDLDSIFRSLQKKHFFSMIIQILYALYIMHVNYFYHNDISKKNICYKKTNLEYIKIFNYKVPTYGYIFSLIDFEMVSSSKFITDFWKLYVHNFKNSSFFDNIRLLYCIIDNIEFVSGLNDKDKIFKIQNKLQDIVINKKLSLEDLKILENPVLDIEEIKYYIKNINNEKKLIKYLYNKLNL